MKFVFVFVGASAGEVRRSYGKLIFSSLAARAFRHCDFKHLDLPIAWCLSPNGPVLDGLDSKQLGWAFDQPSHSDLYDDRCFNMPSPMGR